MVVIPIITSHGLVGFGDRPWIYLLNEQKDG